MGAEPQQGTFAKSIDALANLRLVFLAVDKQKMLLSDDVGHFSLIRAMHLADLITLMNGNFFFFFSFHTLRYTFAFFRVVHVLSFFLLDCWWQASKQSMFFFLRRSSQR